MPTYSKFRNCLTKVIFDFRKYTKALVTVIYRWSGQNEEKKDQYSKRDYSLYNFLPCCTLYVLPNNIMDSYKAFGSDLFVPTVMSNLLVDILRVDLG